MMKKFSFIALVIIISTSISYSQQVIAAAGETFSNGDISISWTLGEVVIDAYEGDGMVITQGFHQPEYVVTSVEQFNYREFELFLYPVPSRDVLNIDISGEIKHQMNYTITDLSGKIIKTGTIEKAKTRHQVDVSGLATGNYYILIYRKDGKQQSTYQIQKIK